MNQLSQLAKSKQGKDLFDKAKTFANDPETRQKIDDARGKLDKHVETAKQKMAEKKAKDGDSSPTYGEETKAGTPTYGETGDPATQPAGAGQDASGTPGAGTQDEPTYGEAGTPQTPTYGEEDGPKAA